MFKFIKSYIFKGFLVVVFINLFYSMYSYKIKKVIKAIRYKFKYRNKHKFQSEDDLDKNKLQETILFEYSIEKSTDLFFRKEESSTYRPSELKRKSNSLINERLKMKDSKYLEARKRLISLNELEQYENLSNRSIRVFVEAIFDTKAIVRDELTVKEIDLQNVYDIAGEFTIINLNKEKGNIKINYISKDN